MSSLRSNGESVTLRAIRPVVSLVGLGIILAACNSAATRESSAHRSPTCLQRTTPPLCYNPLQLRRAYDVQPLLDRGITGKGRTIVVIAVEGTTTRRYVPFAVIRSSLHRYDQIFGLRDPVLTVAAPYGGALTATAAAEATEDIEVAHTMAPGATITVVIPNNDRSFALSTGDFRQKVSVAASELLRIINYAVNRSLGDVISLTYGVGEDCLPPSVQRSMQRIFRAAEAKRITVLAAAGDVGAFGGIALGHLCSPSASRLIPTVILPAADPLVTSVGGTTLRASPRAGMYQGERVWNRSIPSPSTKPPIYQVADVATGGGVSHVFRRPSYQDGIPGIGVYRGVPDVSFDADLWTGVPVVVEISGRTYIRSLGGTSAGAPAWAGIAALADQYANQRLGLLNTALYRIARGTGYHRSFHDVTRGTNSVTVLTPQGRPIHVNGYAAKPGWDMASGWGTPRVAVLVSELARYAKPGHASNR